MKQLVAACKQLQQSGNNPAQIMQIMAAKNPAFNQLQSLANANGGDYKAAFFNAAKAKGYTEEQAMTLAKEISKYY